MFSVTNRSLRPATVYWPVLVTCHNFVTFGSERRAVSSFQLLSTPMFFLHPQLVVHSISHFRPAAIVFVRGFRSPLAYSISHSILHLAHYQFPSSRAMGTKQKCDNDKPVVHSPDALRILSCVPSFRAMATKQKCNGDKPVVHFSDTLRALLCSAIMKYGSAEVALHHVMETHDFSCSLLQQILSGLSIPF
jgi:hypothetical protein